MIKKISDQKLIRWIDTIRFWINLITALLFMYLAYELNRPISMGIGWLLLIGWVLGAYERKLLRKRRRIRRLLRNERRRCAMYNDGKGRKEKTYFKNETI